MSRKHSTSLELTQLFIADLAKLGIVADAAKAAEILQLAENYLAPIKAAQDRERTRETDKARVLDGESLEIFSNLVRKIFRDEFPQKEYPELTFTDDSCFIGARKQFTREEKEKILSSLSSFYTTLNPSAADPSKTLRIEGASLFYAIQLRTNPTTSVDIEFIKSLTSSIKTINSLTGLADAGIDSVAQRRTIDETDGVLLHRESKRSKQTQYLFATDTAFFFAEKIDDAGGMKLGSATDVNQPAVRDLLARSIRDIEKIKAEENARRLLGARPSTSKAQEAEPSSSAIDACSPPRTSMQPKGGRLPPIIRDVPGGATSRK